MIKEAAKPILIRKKLFNNSKMSFVSIRTYQIEQLTYNWIWSKAVTRTTNRSGNHSWKIITENRKKAVNPIVGQKVTTKPCLASAKISSNRKDRVGRKTNNWLRLRAINTMQIVSASKMHLNKGTRVVAVASVATFQTTSSTKCITRSATSKPKPLGQSEHPTWCSTSWTSSRTSAGTNEWMAIKKGPRARRRRRAIRPTTPLPIKEDKHCATTKWICMQTAWIVSTQSPRHNCFPPRELTYLAAKRKCSTTWTARSKKITTIYKVRRVWAVSNTGRTILQLTRATESLRAITKCTRGKPRGQAMRRAWNKICSSCSKSSES